MHFKTIVIGLMISFVPATFAADSGILRGSVEALRDTAQPMFTTLTVGPSLTTGLNTDAALYGVGAALNYNYTQNISGKAFADLAFGDAASMSRFMNFGVGADYYPFSSQIRGGAPYLSAIAGWATTRNEDENTENGVAIGAGLGVRLAAAKINWDVNLNYTTLTSQNAGTTPTVLALRGGVNF